jgi:hypothetical protein
MLFRCCRPKNTAVEPVSKPNAIDVAVKQVDAPRAAPIQTPAEDAPVFDKAALVTLQDELVDLAFQSNPGT